MPPALRTRLFHNLPNFLTVLRLILVPFVAQSLWTGRFRQSLLLLFVAGTTDALDGYLARRFGWTTKVGAYLDPVGDKLLLVAVYVVLGLNKDIPRWLMWLVLGRDAWILTMVAIALLFTSVRVFPPSVWGKISTIVQVFAALVVIALRGYPNAQSAWLEPILIIATAAATLWSGLHYTWLAARQFSSVRVSNRG